MKKESVSVAHKDIKTFTHYAAPSGCDARSPRAAPENRHTKKKEHNPTAQILLYEAL